MITYYITLPIFWILGKLPLFIKGWLSDGLFFLLYRVVKYRIRVVRDNLEKSFPEKSESELRAIERKFYAHLSDIFVESISMVSLSKKQMKSSVEYLNVEQIEEYTKGKSWVSMMSHYGTWELTTNWGMYSQHDGVCAVYKTVANKGYDRLLRQSRGRYGVELVPMEQLARKLLTYREKGESVAVAMISDQSAPQWKSTGYWRPFFGRMAPFFLGAEKVAIWHKMPVAFLHIDKVKRFKYKAWFEVIYDGEEKIERGDIVNRYADRLEEMIRKRPELWMWSHKRWKHPFPGYTKRQWRM